MNILVDADACPVVRIIEQTAKKYNIPVTLLCDTNHVLNSDYSEVKVIGAGADCAGKAVGKTDMRLEVKRFAELTTNELYEILKVRAEVFVVEQNCVYQDLDDMDYQSIHVFYEEEGEILAYLRIFEKERDSKTVQMGRVLTALRGIGLGTKILSAGIPHVQMIRRIS